MDRDSKSGRNFIMQETEPATRAIISRVKNTEMAISNSLINPNIKASLMKIKWRAKAPVYRLMGDNTSASGRIISCMEMECIPGRMVEGSLFDFQLRGGVS